MDRPVPDSQLPFKVKVCGVRRLRDVAACVRAGVGAIGFNFYRPSSRFVSPVECAELAVHVPETVSKVGVFVNHTLEEVRKAAAECRLDFVQLHGDEPLSFVECLVNEGFEVIKVLRIPGQETSEIEEPELEALVEKVSEELAIWSSFKLAGVLLDAKTGSAYGGTGLVFPWKIVPGLEFSAPVVLAGGLTPQNVSNAIVNAKPFAVDVASGVESDPGEKSEAAIQEFVKQAISAWEALDG